MPLIYGKTQYSIGNDLRKLPNGNLLTMKESASQCVKYFSEHYESIAQFMTLLNTIGWFCSKLDRPVIYNTSYITTVQDYMCSAITKISIYDKMIKLNRKATLKLPTPAHDSRKTYTATCVNFIHQRDAYIAMKVVEEVTRRQISVYTVHNNFITPATHTEMMPNIYTNVIKKMGPNYQ